MGLRFVVVEAGLAAGYVVAWALRKARRIGKRLDADADEVIDASLDRLHDVVEARLAGHPVLAELVEEAKSAHEVSDLTCRRVELEIAAAADKDELFGVEVTALVDRLRKAEQASGRTVVAGAGSVVLAGDAHAEARDGGIAIGQVARDVHVHRDPPDPSMLGRPGH